mmetsp:Transcript_11734/g.18875  ORF Transcript_11734/g.18875 Transcript_11734/m.18875 type:complete len:213 (+) Transcript_11734:846-1484(+)
MASRSASFFSALHRVPKGIHFLKRAFFGAFAVLGQCRLNRAKAAGELCVGAAQRLFGVDVEMAGKIGHNEQKITHFVDHVLVTHRVARFDQFGRFLLDLVDHMRCVGPVKADAGGAFLQFESAQQRGQVHGHPVQRAALRFARPFGSLDRLPVAGLLFGGFIAVFIAKHMRMPGHHLVRNICHDRLKRKMPRLFANRCVIDRLQQKIAQFAL